MAALESQVIHDGTASLDGSPQRQQRLDSARSQDGQRSSKDEFQDDSARESARSASLQESLQLLQQQLALKDFILDSLEDMIPSGHVDQVRQKGAHAWLD